MCAVGGLGTGSAGLCRLPGAGQRPRHRIADPVPDPVAIPLAGGEWGQFYISISISKM
jgi:hypothetical protein